MRITDNNSICNGCKKFVHECNYGNDENCLEYCSSRNMDIKDKFSSDETITECLDYEE